MCDVYIAISKIKFSIQKLNKILGDTCDTVHPHSNVRYNIPNKFYSTHRRLLTSDDDRK